MPVMFTSTPSSATTTVSYQIKEKTPTTGEAICAVCGDGHAKLHYGAFSLKFRGNPISGSKIDTIDFSWLSGFAVGNVEVLVNSRDPGGIQRNSCRYCRFNRCIEVGMDPKAVRPDRDLTGKQKVPRIRKKPIDEELLSHVLRLHGDDWSRKLNSDTRILLLQLMNIEAKVVKGDNMLSTSTHPPKDPRTISLKEMFEQKPLMDGRRTEVGIIFFFKLNRTEQSCGLNN
uniref:Nuclear receptor domain-containing protein n=1 Tax=Angiostrongylus cantonensis TaxID=6313 RepID=A0A0K0DQF0_ANGCA